MKKIFLSLIIFTFLFSFFESTAQAKYIDSKGRVWDSKAEYQEVMGIKPKPKKKAPAKKVVPKNQSK